MPFRCRRRVTRARGRLGSERANARPDTHMWVRSRRVGVRRSRVVACGSSAHRGAVGGLVKKRFSLHLDERPCGKCSCC